jgi:glutamine amidotransferase
MRVGLIDYGAGNLASVRKALQACGAEVFTPAAPPEVAGARALVIPGVGHFAATAALDEAWRRAVRDVIADGRPLLGICLGLQWLFEGSSEAPEMAGLGVFAGRCAHLRDRAGMTLDPAVKVPHVGWNAVSPTRPSVLLTGVEPADQTYFTHAYAAPVTPDTVATTAHGATFASVVRRGRVCGVQFHPEKSGPVGLAVLRNFLLMAAGRS